MFKQTNASRIRACGAKKDVKKKVDCLIETMALYAEEVDERLTKGRQIFDDHTNRLIGISKQVTDVTMRASTINNDVNLLRDDFNKRTGEIVGSLENLTTKMATSFDNLSKKIDESKGVDKVLYTAPSPPGRLKHETLARRSIVPEGT